MFQYYNPAQGQGHPALSKLYNIDVESVLSKVDINWYLSTRFMRRQIKAAAARCKSRYRDIELVIREIHRSNPKHVSSTVSQERISERCHMCISTVRKIISGLRQTGTLLVIHNYRNTDLGRRRTASTNILIPLRDWIIKKSSIFKNKSLQPSNNSQLSVHSNNLTGNLTFSTETGEIFVNTKPPKPRKPSESIHSREMNI